MSNTRRLWLVLVLAGCAGGSTNPPPPPPPATPPPPPPPGGGNPGPTAGVEMRQSDDGYGTAVNSFNPSTVSVTAAGTVTWTNTTGILHNVTFAQTAGVPPSIPSFAAGSTSRTFSTVGTFTYSCTNHPGMSGSVTVQ